MKHIPTYEEFVNESKIFEGTNDEYINDNLRMGAAQTTSRTQDRSSWILFTYTDTGKPKFSKPIEEIWADLYAELKPLGMPKRLVPASNFTRADLTLKDGTVIMWRKSSPPLRYLIIETPPENVLKWKEILTRVTEVGTVDTHQHLIDIWEKLPKEIQEFFQSWSRPLGVKDLSSGDDDQFFIDTNRSSFSDKTEKITGIKFVADPKTTGWDLYGRNFHYRMDPHTYNSSVRCTKK